MLQHAYINIPMYIHAGKTLQLSQCASRNRDKEFEKKNRKPRKHEISSGSQVQRRERERKRGRIHIYTRQLCGCSKGNIARVSHDSPERSKDYGRESAGERRTDCRRAEARGVAAPASFSPASYYPACVHLYMVFANCRSLATVYLIEWIVSCILLKKIYLKLYFIRYPTCVIFYPLQFSIHYTS